MEFQHITWETFSLSCYKNLEVHITAEIRMSIIRPYESLKGLQNFRML